MENFDADKIKDMEYDPSRGRYVAKDGREFKSTPYSNGTGYKYDYYGSTTYKNAKHNSTHVKSDLNENWTRTDNNRDDNTSNSSKGSGCYLTTACMKHYLNNFDDNCYELSVLRWFRDNFVSNEDIEHYYNTAPYIVEGIEKEDNKDIVYNVPLVSLFGGMDKTRARVQAKVYNPFGNVYVHRLSRPSA